MELTPGVRDLLSAASKAREHAYCPYSGYAVGAAVMLTDGSVATGCNVENFSYGLTICAERNAIAAAALLSNNPPGILALALVAGPVIESTISPPKIVPCGACLQVLAEFASPNFRAVCAEAGKLDEAVSYTLSELIPHAFGNS